MNVFFSILTQIIICQLYAIFYRSPQSSHYFLSPLGGVEEQTVFNTIVSMASDQEKTVSMSDNEILHPPDGAGPTVLSSAARGSQLPPFGERVWKEGGSKTVETEIARRNSRSWRNDTAQKSYWPVVIGPIFAENPTTGDLLHDLPFQIPNTAPGFTINYWYQSLMENRSDGMCLTLYTKSCDVPNCQARHDAIFDNRFAPNRARSWINDPTGDCPDDCVVIGHCSYGFYDRNFIERVNRKEIDGSWRIYTGINNGLWSEDDESQSKPDELFFNAKNTAEMLPVAWRMLTIQVDLVSKILRFYLDGEFVQESSPDEPVPSWFRVSDFSDGNLPDTHKQTRMHARAHAQAHTCKRAHTHSRRDTHMILLQTDTHQHEQAM